ncbi:MAG: prenyltransferase [Bdellovibrio sp.]
MSELRTLSRSSAEFEAYLLGTFSRTHRAVPVQTLNANSGSETVTFRIVPLEQISRPSGWMIALKTLKVRSFILVMVPLFVVLTKNTVDRTLADGLTTLIATIGVLFAFAAVDLRNDYMDHIKGVDRIFQNSGSRAIQNGWLTAAQVKALSVAFLVVALLCAMSLIVAFPVLAGVMAVALVVGVWAQFQKKNSFKYQIGGELALFVLLGPLLTVGYQLAMGVHFDRDSFWIGCLWGWLVLFVLHLRNFVNLLPSVQAGFSNTVNWLGFDRSRRMLALWWGLFIVFNCLYHVFYAGLIWGVFFTFALLVISIRFILRLKALSSPVGSEVHSIFRSGLYLFLFAISLWVIECLWYLLI